MEQSKIIDTLEMYQKPKGSATATRREEAAAKAAQFQRAPKQPPTVSA